MRAREPSPLRAQEDWRFWFSQVALAQRRRVGDRLTWVQDYIMSNFSDQTGDGTNESKTWIDFSKARDGAIATNRLASNAATTNKAPVTTQHTPPETRLSPRVAAVLAYIAEAHSRSSCRLSEISAQLHVSRSYLSRLVLRETGLSYNKHLQHARMTTAARLLQSTHLSVKDISSSTGYEHVPSFDRQFRNHFKMTPGEFRRRPRA